MTGNARWRARRPAREIIQLLSDFSLWKTKSPPKIGGPIVDPVVTCFVRPQYPDFRLGTGPFAISF